MIDKVFFFTDTISIIFSNPILYVLDTITGKEIESCNLTFLEEGEDTPLADKMVWVTWESSEELSIFNEKFEKIGTILW